MAIRDETDHYR